MTSPLNVPGHREDRDLETWLGEQFAHVRQLADGSFAAMDRLAYTTGVFLGVTRWGFETRYCYQDPAEARAVFDALQSEDDRPVGWIARRPETAEDRAAKARPGYRGGDPARGDSYDVPPV